MRRALNRGPRSARPGVFGLLVALLGLALTGCGREAGDDYFPLPPGRYWQYHVHTETMKYPSDLKLTVRALPPADWQGAKVERKLVNDRYIHFLRRDAEGVFRVATTTPEAESASPDEPPEPVLVYPLEVGRTWTQTSTTGVLDVVVDPFRLQVYIHEPVAMTYRVAALDDVVRVPAGRFEGCLRIEGKGHGRYKGMSAILPADITVEQTDWYAPGVGLVKTLRIERTTSIVVPKGEFRLELERVEDRGAGGG